MDSELLKVLLVAFQLAQYGGPPMWVQMPPQGSYDAPPGVLQPDGPYGPGSPYNAPDMSGPDSGPQPWMQNYPPPRLPPSPFVNPGVRPGGNMDGDGDDDE